MASISTATVAPATTRRKARLLTVGGAVLAALVVWGFAKLALGDLRQPAFGSARPQHLSAGLVVVAGLIGSLLGWALLALLERFTSRSRQIWAIAAPLTLLASLAAPLSGHGIGGGNRLALLLMHLAVGGMLIPFLYRSSNSGDQRERG